MLPQLYSPLSCCVWYSLRSYSHFCSAIAFSSFLSFFSYYFYSLSFSVSATRVRFSISRCRFFLSTDIACFNFKKTSTLRCRNLIETGKCGLERNTYYTTKTKPSLTLAMPFVFLSATLQISSFRLSLLHCAFSFSHLSILIFKFDH